MLEHIEGLPEKDDPIDDIKSPDLTRWIELHPKPEISDEKKDKTENNG